MAAVSWEGTYENGLTNNMDLDEASTFAFVNYYNLYGIGGSGLQAQVTYDDFVSGSDDYGLTSDNTYHGVGVRFPMLQSPGGTNWAKSGSLYVYMDLVNQSNGPLLQQLTVNGKYAHHTIGSTVGVSFPGGVSINFTGSYSVYGVKNQTINAR